MLFQKYLKKIFTKKIKILKNIITKEIYFDDIRKKFSLKKRNESVFKDFQYLKRKFLITQ